MPFYIHSKYVDDPEYHTDVDLLVEESFGQSPHDAHMNETPLYIRHHIEDPLFL